MFQAFLCIACSEQPAYPSRFCSQAPDNPPSLTATFGGLVPTWTSAPSHRSHEDVGVIGKERVRPGSTCGLRKIWGPTASRQGKIHVACRHGAAPHHFDIHRFLDSRDPGDWDSEGTRLSVVTAQDVEGVPGWALQAWMHFRVKFRCLPEVVIRRMGLLGCGWACAFRSTCFVSDNLKNR